MTSMYEASACACAVSPGPASPVQRRAAPYWRLALSLGLAALVPKCPMCLAAYLSLIGLGGGLAAYAHPFMRPLSILIVALAVAGLLLQRRRG
jgi:hypothetical protein